MRAARNKAVVGMLGLLVALAVAAVAFTRPDGASATAQSEVRPLNGAALRTDVRQALTRAATRVGVKAADVREVAAKGDASRRAGMYLGRDARGREQVSVFGPQAFTTFTAAEKVAPADRPLYASTSAQPGPDSTKTGHVQLCGVVGPTVTKVEIALADGSAISADIVRLKSDGYGFFTYVSDTPSSFPGLVRAFSANGQEVGSEDVSRAIAPPQVQ